MMWFPTIIILYLIQYSLSYSSVSRKIEVYKSGQSSVNHNLRSISSSSEYYNCCRLNPWAYNNYEVIQEFANRLRQEYNSMATGNIAGYSFNYNPWSENIIILTGKTPGELDALCRYLAEQLINDMHNGLLNYSTIIQSTFFEWKTMLTLQPFSRSSLDFYRPRENHHLDIIHSKDNRIDDVQWHGYREHNYGTKTNYQQLSNLNKPTSVHVPVDYRKNLEIDTSPKTGDYNINGSPKSTVTIARYNETILTNPVGKSVVHSSEAHEKWVNGKLVYNTGNPFGDQTICKDDAWKCTEREHLFWFLTPGAISYQHLNEWQRLHGVRLLNLSKLYRIPIESIHNWHRTELERYQALKSQYEIKTSDYNRWQRAERGRLDWLIHQNSLTPTELERWQQENYDQLNQLARQYHISLNDLQEWQKQELKRLYTYFDKQNNSLFPSNLHASPNQNNEQLRLENLIRQHNATIEQLHNSIRTDQQKLRELSVKYRGNVGDIDKWLKNELARLGNIITEQRSEVDRITMWQRSERERLENLVKQHRGSLVNIDSQISRDDAYLKTLADKYHVSIDELQNWERSEIKRLQNENQFQIEAGIKEWQQKERERLNKLIAKNDLTIEEFQKLIINDRQRLQNLAQTYKVQVTEIEEWLRKELSDLKNQGALQTIKQELSEWQQKEREYLLKIIRQNDITVQDLERKIKNDQNHLNDLANKYHIHVNDVENWLKQELFRLQNQGVIKAEELDEWQKKERDRIMLLVQQNKLTIDEFEQKLLADKERLKNLSQTYHVQLQDVESWIKHEGERLQQLGLIQIQDKLNNWQKIERDHLLNLVQQNNYSINELEEQIKNDQTHLSNVAQQHHVRVKEIEDWITEEIKRLQEEGLIELEKLRDWQLEWRGNLTNMVRERDFTVEEFHKWLLEDRDRLQKLATKHNMHIEELEEWIKTEEKRFITLGLLKPNEKLTNWQEIERRYLERISQDHYHSTEQLEQRLRQDRELLEKLARDYQIQVEEIETWMKKELSRLRDEGQLQINNLTSWQIAEREYIDNLLKQNKYWSVEELENILKEDRKRLQKTAFQYHTSVEEIEDWLQKEIDKLKEQGKINIENYSTWQREQYQRILNLLREQSSITEGEFENKVAQDRAFFMNLAQQYHISINEIEEYIKKVINDLREKGKFEIESLKSWQLAERDYIKQFINKYKNTLSTEEYEEKLLNDRLHLQQLAEHYHINVSEIESWLLKELHRLRDNTSDHIQKLAAWQAGELERLKQLIRERNHINYIQFEIELKKENDRLQNLSNQYSISVEQIEQWLREQLLNLKTSGRIQVDNLAKWQVDEQKRLIALCLQQQKYISNDEFEQILKRDRQRIERLARDHHLSVNRIEQWMNGELTRLQNSGLVKVQQLSQWQKSERKRLEDWLKQQQRDITTTEFEMFIKRDRDRFQRIAQDYHVTIEEIESWIEEEEARLKILGFVKPLRQQTHSQFQGTSYPRKTEFTENKKVTSINNDMWKIQTKAHLQATFREKPFTWIDFENYLINELPRWQQFARQYHVSVDNIQEWLRQSAQDLIKRGYIQNRNLIKEWQIAEQNYMQSLVNEKLRKQERWSIEELERKLLNDHDHIQRIANIFHLSIEDIENWYQSELQRLLQQRKIYSENLNDWQKIQKDTIFNIVTRQHGKTLSEVEEQLLNDYSTLARFSSQHHISMDELKMWIRNELRRLKILGFITDNQNNHRNNNNSDWQRQERERLRNIANDLILTEEEFLDFIANDLQFQRQLAHLYGCGLEQLVPFQRIELNKMLREGLLDRTVLLDVEPWQKNERNRLYNLLRDQSYSLDNLRNWHKQDAFFDVLAVRYGITVNVLKDWHIKEFNRLNNLALYYKLNLNQIQDFRDKELSYINYIMHKKLITDQERKQWASNENQHIEILQRTTGLIGEDLINWRRRFYLLCQGRLAFYNGDVNNAGHLTSPRHIIYKNRGDQPPYIHEERIDLIEPSIVEDTYTSRKHKPIYDRSILDDF